MLHTWIGCVRLAAESGVLMVGALNINASRFAHVPHHPSGEGQNDDWLGMSIGKLHRLIHQLG